MGLNVWFMEDVARTLAAIREASAEVFDLVTTPEMQLYRMGYEAALRAVAVAFDVELVEDAPQGAGRCLIQLPVGPHRPQ